MKIGKFRVIFNIFYQDSSERPQDLQLETCNLQLATQNASKALLLIVALYKLILL